MWIKCNPNPKGKEVPDCVVRAVSIALGLDWYTVYDGLYETGRAEADMPSSNAVWDLYLRRMGFRPFYLPKYCPDCTTIRMFCKFYPIGAYVIGTGSHAVAVINGDYYDTWDSGDEIPTFFWMKF